MFVICKQIILPWQLKLKNNFMACATEKKYKFFHGNLNWKIENIINKLK
jgi:hypothetical protein